MHVIKPWLQGGIRKAFIRVEAHKPFIMKNNKPVPTGMDLFKAVKKSAAKSQSFAEPNGKIAGAQDAQRKKKTL